MRPGSMVAHAFAALAQEADLVSARQDPPWKAGGLSEASATGCAHRVRHAGSADALPSSNFSGASREAGPLSMEAWRHVDP